MTCRYGWMLAGLLGFQLIAGAADPRADLEALLKILPRTSTKMTRRINAIDKTWEEWLQRTGELPPDFDSLPSQPFLPDLVVCTG